MEMKQLLWFIKQAQQKAAVTVAAKLSYEQDKKEVIRKELIDSARRRQATIARYEKPLGMAARQSPRGAISRRAVRWLEMIKQLMSGNYLFQSVRCEEEEREQSNTCEVRSGKQQACR